MHSRSNLHHQIFYSYTGLDLKYDSSRVILIFCYYMRVIISKHNLKTLQIILIKFLASYKMLQKYILIPLENIRTRDLTCTVKVRTKSYIGSNIQRIFTTFSYYVIFSYIYFYLIPIYIRISYSISIHSHFNLKIINLLIIALKYHSNRHITHPYILIIRYHMSTIIQIIKIIEIYQKRSLLSSFIKVIMILSHILTGFIQILPLVLYILAKTFRIKYKGG